MLKLSVSLIFGGTFPTEPGEADPNLGLPVTGVLLPPPLPLSEDFWKVKHSVVTSNASE